MFPTTENSKLYFYYKKYRSNLFYLVAALILLFILINQIKSCNQNVVVKEVVINSNDNLYNYQKSLLRNKILVLQKQLDSVGKIKDSIRIKYVPLYISVYNKEDKRDEILYEHGVLDDTFVSIEDNNQLIDFRLVQGLEARANYKLCIIQTKILGSVIEEYKESSSTDSVYIYGLKQDLTTCKLSNDSCSNNLAIAKSDLSKEKKKGKNKNWIIAGLAILATLIGF